MSENIKISIRNLYKIFGDKPSSVIDHVRNGVGKTELLEKHKHILGLQNINLDIEERHIHVIMGLSGSGKSTLIRHFNRLIEPTAGEIYVDGNDVMKLNELELREFRRHNLSMVFQKFGLLPHRTVIDNVGYGLAIQGIKGDELKQRSQKWLDRVGLSGFEKHYPTQLSGGMQQRVGLARALATDSDILLMDEAFSALDPLIRTDMQTMLLDLQADLHKTIVFITHDLDEALRIGDRITILRDGAIIQDAPPQDIVMRPADEYISEFIRDINRGRVVEVGSIMAPIGSSETSGSPIQVKSSLEDALPLISEAPTHALSVVNKEGAEVGVVTANDIMKGIARPEVGDGRKVKIM
ncbi:MAG: glycine betaine/L-proline ABC transporter ATP-binding protein [Alphaproteobacteria bacterium]|nr:glycine betaine/L-proline ABC transporter ATP-binding protein [Alphaproteobacteria bacterium]